MESFNSLFEAQLLLEDWRLEYNHYRPHQALNYRTPAEYARHCSLVVMTQGAQGATLFLRGSPHQIAAFPAVERDPTGAGDVFAAALLVRLHETGDPITAARFAACVAAGSVEGVGSSRVPTRAEVQQRMAAESYSGLS